MHMFVRVMGILVALIFVSVLYGQERSSSRGQERLNEELHPLSDAQADAIIAEQADARELQKADRKRHRIRFTVLERKEVKLGEKKLIVNRVTPPRLSKQIAPPRDLHAPAQELAAVELAEMQRLQDKEYRSFFLSATVYSDNLTELNWSHEGVLYTAWSNVNFNYLQFVSDFETDQAIYSVLVFCNDVRSKQRRVNGANTGSQEMEQASFEIPKLPSFTPGRAEYFVITDNSALIDIDEIFEPIDALHGYYEQNARHLRVQHQRRNALNEARRRYQEANPEEPEDTVINFWPVKGSIYNEESD